MQKFPLRRIPMTPGLVLGHVAVTVILSGVVAYFGVQLL